MYALRTYFARSTYLQCKNVDWNHCLVQCKKNWPSFYFLAQEIICRISSLDRTMSTMTSWLTIFFSPQTFIMFNTCSPVSPLISLHLNHNAKIYFYFVFTTPHVKSQFTVHAQLLLSHFSTHSLPYSSHLLPPPWIY